MISHTYVKRFPFYGLIALTLCLLSWACSWLRIDPFFRYSFFPLWFGYIFFIDALNVTRHGTSLFSRMGWRFSILFLFSAIFWWIFETFNVPTQNWHYILDHPYTPFNYFLLASIDFSTVLPAVLGTAELVATFMPLPSTLAEEEPGPVLPRWIAIAIIIFGIICCILPWIYPHYFFPLIWLCLIFLIDPINNLCRRRSASANILARNWRFLSLPLGALICGFFWEMWNYYALPKWYYTVPYIGFWKVFEMPLLGFSGYLPFGLELFALYQLALFITRRKKDYLII